MDFASSAERAPIRPGAVTARIPVLSREIGVFSQTHREYWYRWRQRLENRISAYWRAAFCKARGSGADERLLGELLGERPETVARLRCDALVENDFGYPKI